MAVLQYTLCPAAQYPTQLCRAALALSHLLNSGIAARDIIIGGDSAGGNLAAQLLCHLVHPHHDVEFVKLGEPLAGAFTASPLVSALTNTRSFLDNQYIDMLSPPIVENSVRELLHSSMCQVKRDQTQSGWAMPMDVDLS
ncbi:hypothetical protein F4677DRAFT_447949 [Hypoxylon crocopeplum]|nr:hypothetical protein F4677DRAFT_447949 [Hypoxylon crocopeplum]